AMFQLFVDLAYFLFFSLLKVVLQGGWLQCEPQKLQFERSRYLVRLPEEKGRRQVNGSTGSSDAKKRVSHIEPLCLLGMSRYNFFNSDTIPNIAALSIGRYLY
uniref:Uncharacterized protein n=1 Tax=Gouania willdenowi TaxID=441366 RepID=A0A8C5EIL8_GOUWI